MLVALQLVGFASVPLKLTVPVPCVAPKLVPVIVTDAPTTPEVTERLLIVAAGTTVKLTPLLATPDALTTIFPVVAPDGTGAEIVDALQLVGVEVVPLKLTEPLPWVAPKFAPAMATSAPTAPLVGERVVMLGAGTTVKVDPLLATPPAAVTTTLPVVAPLGTVAVMLLAPQMVTVALTPLKVTPPLPWVAPKFVPAITMDDPTAPVFGVNDVMLGTAVTVNVTPELAIPPAAVTTTLPVVAPLGTVAVMLLAPQLVIVVALTPLNFTLPFPTLGPKLDPVITIDDPTAPVFGVNKVMLGAPVTVKVCPLLALPETVTITFPVVAPVGTVAVMLDAAQAVVVAVVPLNLTVLLP